MLFPGLESPRRITAAVAAAVTAAGLVMGAIAPAAQAAPGNMAIFGDSIIADSNLGEYLAARAGAHPNGSSNAREWCPTGPNSFGKQAARQLGLEPRDYSCSGSVAMSTGPQLHEQVSRAISSGGLNADTRRVLVQIGINDTYNHLGRPPQDVRRDFVHHARPQIDRIKKAAPNARIQLLGYPTITLGDRVCTLHFGPNMYTATPIPVVRDLEWLAEDMQKDLARATGTEFLDLKQPTWKNGLCGRDEDRMMAGIIDFHAGPGNSPLHVNERGHNYLAGVVAHS